MNASGFEMNFVFFSGKKLSHRRLYLICMPGVCFFAIFAISKKINNQKPNIMKRYFLLILAIGFAAYSCAPRTQQEEARERVFESETHQEFFDNLASLCGQSFAGTQIYRSHHSPGWAHLDMVMHVTVCEEERIHIPFHVGDDQSRTWMFLAEDGQLRFRHDHRYPDGTPEEGSLYGGYADDSGTAFEQHFPADDFTATVVEGGGGNVWTVRISEDFTTFTYRLERDGEKRLRVDFDLTNPL
jgi:hypothetical protein